MAKQLAVIGAGLMGAGIAQVSAVAGYQVVLRDVTPEATARGLAGIEASLDKFVAKGKLAQQDAEAALARITTTTDLGAAGEHLGEPFHLHPGHGRGVSFEDDVDDRVHQDLLFVSLPVGQVP